MEKIKFKDSIKFDNTTKTAVSIRDGIQEYLGAEINKEPATKLFKLYRSPATIGNVAIKMVGLPLTNDHVDFKDSKKESIGKVADFEFKSLIDSKINSTLCVKNKIEVDNSILNMLTADKKELSLGYEAILKPSNNPEYDFEQIDIIPNHLAVVKTARGGEECKILDSKGAIMKFKDKIKNSFKTKFKDEDDT